jgi:hypothetical protein
MICHVNGFLAYFIDSHLEGETSRYHLIYPKYLHRGFIFNLNFIWISVILIGEFLARLIF